MKGEYVEEKKDINNSSSCSNMFAKLHPTQKFQHHPNPPPHPHHPHPQQPQPLQASLHHHPFQVLPECQTSEEADSRSPNTPSTNTTPTVTAKKDPQSAPSALVGPPSSTNDGASIEVVRRPRGRPPGSKNKPKPPVIITRETEPPMSPYIIEVPGGVDVVEAVTSYCRKRNMGLCILNGSGTVSNVTLRQPSTTPGATVTFHGRFDILSISATIVAPNTNLPSLSSIALNNGIANGFTISLAGPQGQVVGGAVVGPLLSAGTLYLIAATFNNPSYHRLPVEDEARNSGSAGGGGNEGRHHSPSAVSGGADSGHPPAAGDSCGMSIYNCHLPSDVIWAPTARPPPPPPPPY